MPRKFEEIDLKKIRRNIVDCEDFGFIQVLADPEYYIEREYICSKSNRCKNYDSLICKTKYYVEE